MGRDSSFLEQQLSICMLVGELSISCLSPFSPMAGGAVSDLIELGVCAT